MKGKIGIALIIVGVILATIYASFTPIEWIKFSASAIVIAIGIVLQRSQAKNELINSKRENISFANFQKELIALQEKAEHFAKNLSENEGVIIEEEFSDVIPDIEKYRFAIVDEIGIAEFTELITIYAKGERKINRAVSAAIDGYISEAKNNFTSAITTLDECINKSKRLINE